MKGREGERVNQQIISKLSAEMDKINCRCLGSSLFLGSTSVMSI